MRIDLEQLKSFPSILSKDQMIIACHISKRTATYLLKSGLIPCTSTGTKSPRYMIRKEDLIAFIYDREKNPDTLIDPKVRKRDSHSNGKPYIIRVLPDLPISIAQMREYYARTLSSYPDALTVSCAVAFTGYNRRTVHQWIRKRKLKALVTGRKYVIPKCWFIDWLCSKEYNSTNRKSMVHIETLWAISETAQAGISKRSMTGSPSSPR